MVLCVRSIYCQGCSKPLCCSCALLDRDHSDLKCDISAEIQQRQEELDTMAQALQEQDSTFSTAHAQMRSAIGQLGRARADTEELISTRVRQVVAHVLARERELLDAVNEQYQRDYQEMAGQLGRLDAVLQRIRTGGALVQRMKRYASDQEVLDMHDFVHKALNRLRQEEPQSLQAALRTDGFEEFKVRLQDLISCITQRTGKLWSFEGLCLAAVSWGSWGRKDHPHLTEKEIGFGLSLGFCQGLSSGWRIKGKGVRDHGVAGTQKGHILLIYRTLWNNCDPRGTCGS